MLFSYDVLNFTSVISSSLVLNSNRDGFPIFKFLVDQIFLITNYNSNFDTATHSFDILCLCEFFEARFFLYFCQHPKIALFQ